MRRERAGWESGGESEGAQGTTPAPTRFSPMGCKAHGATSIPGGTYTPSSGSALPAPYPKSPRAPCSLRFPNAPNPARGSWQTGHREVSPLPGICGRATRLILSFPTGTRGRAIRKPDCLGAIKPGESGGRLAPTRTVPLHRIDMQRPICCPWGAPGARLGFPLLILEPSPPNLVVFFLGFGSYKGSFTMLLPKEEGFGSPLFLCLPGHGWEPLGDPKSQDKPCQDEAQPQSSAPHLGCPAARRMDPAFVGFVPVVSTGHWSRLFQGLPGASVQGTTALPPSLSCSQLGTQKHASSLPKHSIPYTPTASQPYRLLFSPSERGPRAGAAGHAQHPAPFPSTQALSPVTPSRRCPVAPVQAPAPSPFPQPLYQGPPTHSSSVPLQRGSLEQPQPQNCDFPRCRITNRIRAGLPRSARCAG